MDRAFLIFGAMEYPLYAKHSDGRVWYRIDSESYFIELRRLGDKFLRNEVLAEDYSTYLYIQDLIEALKNGELEEVTIAEFEGVYSRTP